MFPNLSTNYLIPSTPFLPSDLSGLSLWHNVREVGTMTKNGGGIPSNNDFVTQINDKTSNNIHHSQAVLSAMPKYLTSELNGRPALKFDGANDAMRANYNAAISSSTFHYFCVCRLNTLTASAHNPTLYMNSTTNVGARFYIQDTTIERMNVLIRRGGVFNGTTGPTDLDTNTVLYEASYSANTILSLNGNFEASGTVGAYTTAANGFSFLGAGSSGASAATGTPNLWGNVSIGEMLFYNNVKSGSDLTNIRNYLSTGWGTP